MINPQEIKPIAPTGNFTKEKFIQEFGETKENPSLYASRLLGELSVSALTLGHFPRIAQLDVTRERLVIPESDGRIRAVSSNRTFDKKVFIIAAQNASDAVGGMEIVYPHFNRTDGTISGISKIILNDVQLKSLLS